MISNDNDLVNKTLEIYFEGNKELDAKKILSVWDENLKIISTEKTVGPEAWLEMEDYYKTQIDGDMSKWSIDFEVKSIDIFKNCASIRVDVQYKVDSREFGETQFLHMLKKDDVWKFYSKIFVFY